MAKQDDFDRMDEDDDRRSRRSDPPKKKGGIAPILLIIGGIVLLGCCGSCGVGGYWFYQQAKVVADMADGFTVKLGAGDFAGAYAATSTSFKSKYTMEEFTANMKKAKFDQIQSVKWGSNSSSTTNGTGTGAMTGDATLKDGTTTPVSLTLGFDGKAWTIEDITGNTAPPKPKTDDKAKPKDDKPKPKEEDEDK